MHNYSERKRLPYSAEQLYSLVLDVEKYPQFLPWVTGARILVNDKENSFFTAELKVGFKGFAGSYTSRVSYAQPFMDKQDTEWAVYVDLEEGPFRHLENRWVFHPVENNQCEVEFFLDFSFNSKVMEMMLGAVFDKATHKMVEAFEERAKELYNSNLLGGD